MKTGSASSARRARGPAVPPPTGTRERVLDVAHEMIRERGDATISLVEVAARAGLSRQTLYLLFGNRAGLLLALVDRLDATSAGPDNLARARSRQRDDFEPYVRAWFDYLPALLPVARALSAAAAAGDADALHAWQSRQDKLRQGYSQFARALGSGGLLRPGWTERTAADWLLALTHVDLWQHLVVESGWPAAAYVDRIVATLRETLLDTPGRR
jgi:AcrR family transcriptional regulator